MRTSGLVVMSWLLVACSSAKDSAGGGDDEEQMVATLERMAALARENPSCERWADENQRLFGAEQLKTMITRIGTYEGSARERFQARYGERVRVASAVVQPIAQRCVTVLREK
jgi:hypothetical protein